MVNADLAALSPEEKRALLAQLLQDKAVVAEEPLARSHAVVSAVPVEPEPIPADLHPYEAYVNPYVGALLRAVNMDKRYVRGEGCWLSDEEGTHYLDFTAAYGALPFGF